MSIRPHALAWALLLAVPVAAAAAEARLTDAQAEALARTAMAATDPGRQAEILRQLQLHHFKSSLAKERELTLGVQGLLEDRTGKRAQAAVTFHKLEQAWPHSAYLPEGQVIMAEAAVERKRYQEAESRLHQALEADIPAEAQRRGQELLLWCLAEQGRAGEGVPVLAALKPLGTGRPSERGLVGIMEAQCAAQRKAEAEATVKDYHNLFPEGPRALRMDLDWAKLQGATGNPAGAAKGFQTLIQAKPDAPEADEARLALATLLTDGKLPARETKGLPSAQSLLAGLHKDAIKDGSARAALVLGLRLAVKEGRWQEALAGVAQYRGLRAPRPENAAVNQLRQDALRGWAQQLLDQHQPLPLLPYLDGEGIRSLTPEQRLNLARRLAQLGLPEAAEDLTRAAPAGERAALAKAVLAGAAPAENPKGILELLPGRGESAAESLTRAQAELALHEWPGARAALAKASPGPDRIQALLAYLDRPAGARETPAERLKEAEGWLARAAEKGAVREPLAILTADLKARAGDWRGALALYPAAPQPASRGWVALMRATCQAKVGQRDLAKATLKAAADDPAFKNERQSLEQRLGL